MKIRPPKVTALFFLLVFIILIYFVLNRNGQIRLIVRGDDMGFSHAANIRFLPMTQISLFEDAYTLPHMISNAVHILENLEPGTYEFYEHPGMIIEGEEGAWHIGAEGDAAYRDAVTKALISPQLKEVIERRKIQLIGYRDLMFWQ